jgi:predicted RNase H-like HicB family nuclease
MRKNKKEERLGYEIKIIPDKESGYLAVRFPDFPGIITGGYSLEEAIKNAQEALELTTDTPSDRGLPLTFDRTRICIESQI